MNRIHTGGTAPIANIVRLGPLLLAALLAVLSYPLSAIGQTVPYIKDIEGEELGRPEVWEPDTKLRLFGTFKLFNPSLVPFYLWVEFENNGKLTHAKHNDLPSVRMVGFELRYKNTVGQPIVKKFSNSSFNAHSGAYEITFWREEAQEIYEAELWGVLHSPDVKQAVAAGSYKENIKFNIEVMP